MVFLWQDLAAEERVVAAWEPRSALGAPVGLSRWNKCGSISLILCHRPSTMSFESAEYPPCCVPVGPSRTLVTAEEQWSLERVRIGGTRLQRLPTELHRARTLGAEALYFRRPVAA
jgi:hypothetical protein